MITTATCYDTIMRLQQITCGHFTSDDGTIQELKTNRLDELIECLEEDRR